MYHEHAEALSSHFPIEYSAGVPNPVRFPASPDELIAFCKSYHRGLSKITIKLWQGRKRYSQLNSVIVGATHDELPTASVDQIARAVMAVAQDYYESTDQPCKFMAQAHVFLKPTGDATRKAFHFELGHGHESSEAFSEHIGAPEHMDDVMLGHIRECHREILDQARIISEIGREAIANAGQVFAAKQEALDAQAQAQMVILDSRREEAKDRAQQAKWEKGFKLLEKAVNTGVAQAIVGSATGRAVAGALPVASGAGAAPASPPTTPMPAWAAAATQAAPATPAEATEVVASSADLADGVPWGPGHRPGLAQGRLATDADETNEVEMEDESYAGKGRALYQSITAEQWPQLFELLTKAQLKLITGLKDADSDENVLRAAGKLRAALKDGQMAKLGAVLGVEQITLVIELGSAAAELD